MNGDYQLSVESLLKSFVLLMNVTEKGNDNHFELQAITWIGCGLSITGLFLTLLTHGLLK